MKCFALLLILLTIQIAWGVAPVHTIIDYLKETPAAVTGNISLDSSLDLYQGKTGIIPLGMRIKRM